jgi:hypothetical protein
MSAKAPANAGNPAARPRITAASPSAASLAPPPRKEKFYVAADQESKIRSAGVAGPCEACRGATAGEVTMKLNAAFRPRRGLVLAAALALPLTAGGMPAGAAEKTPEAAAKPVDGMSIKSIKERLSDKASDEQRVDNCKVPPERRGSKPRPGCAGESGPASASAAELSAPSGR